MDASLPSKEGLWSVTTAAIISPARGYAYECAQELMVKTERAALAATRSPCAGESTPASSAPSKYGRIVRCPMALVLVEVRGMRWALAAVQARLKRLSVRHSPVSGYPILRI